MPALAKQPERTRGALGHGVYSLAHLRAYVALGGEPKDVDHVVDWLRRVLNPVDHAPYQADYSFSDLVSLFVVRELRRKGVRLTTIRDAESYLRKKWRTDRPFVTDELETDGVGIYFDDELIAGQIESADRHGQQTMRLPIRDRLERVTYKGGIAAYWRPMPHIRVDPRVQFGEPVIDGTRVPTSAVAGVARRAGTEVAASRFDVRPAEVRNAVQFEDEVASLAA